MRPPPLLNHPRAPSDCKFLIGAPSAEMLCDDADSLHEAIQALRSQDSKVSSDSNMDVDRLYNSSPPLMDQVATYELDSLFQNDLEPEREDEDAAGKKNKSDEGGKGRGGDVEEKRECEEEKKKCEEKEKEAGVEASATGAASVPTSSWGKLLCQPREEVFRALPLQPLQAQVSSSLTKQLLSPQFSSQFGGGLKLTIFLPDTNPLVLHVEETSTYEQVIAKVLAVHRDKGIKPPLRYDSPGEYELYLNEGDGIPDRDFVFRKTQKISENKVDEYCLCEADEDAAPSPATMSMSFSANRGSTMRYDTTSRGGGMSPLQGMDTLFVTVLITTSNRGESITVKLPYDDGTTMRHLLLDIADKKKVSIRLYTDEFSFVVSAEDQARLKLISPIVDLSTLVSTVCECKFELQKRAFEDSARVHSRTLASKNSSSVAENLGETNAVLYNETTAVMLQQWNVVKKNKLGSRQERIIGIDGKCIYNSKRDQRPGMGVKVPSRDIALVQSIEVLDDNLTFKINWKEDKIPVYSIEYCCQNERDCAEIQGKINYILIRRRAMK